MPILEAANWGDKYGKNILILKVANWGEYGKNMPILKATNWGDK